MVAAMYLLMERQVKTKRFGLLFSRLPSLQFLDDLHRKLVLWGFLALSLTLPYEKIGAVKRLVHPPEVELVHEEYGAEARLELAVAEDGAVTNGVRDVITTSVDKCQGTFTRYNWNGARYAQGESRTETVCE